jgi:hypothetical protein
VLERRQLAFYFDPACDINLSNQLGPAFTNRPSGWKPFANHFLKRVLRNVVSLLPIGVKQSRRHTFIETDSQVVSIRNTWSPCTTWPKGSNPEGDRLQPRDYREDCQAPQASRLRSLA